LDINGRTHDDDDDDDAEFGLSDSALKLKSNEFSFFAERSSDLRPNVSNDQL